MIQLSDCTTLHNGVKMPWLGLGVWQAKDGKEVENAVLTAIKSGYLSIDTAAAYRNEEGVGKGIKNSGIAREELFITTKVQNGDQGYDSTLKAFEESRKKLDLEYIDLYLVHWPVKGKYKDTWRAMEKLYNDGYVKAIGVSNFQVHHLQDVINSFEIKPMVNQVEFHPFLTQTEIYNFCNEQDIQMEAWSPLMRGGELLKEPLLVELGKKYNKAPAQIILRWDLEKGVVTIPKSVHEDRIRENAAVFDFRLEPEEIQKIDALNKNAQSFEYDPNNVEA
jgi:diketogulonate reductase-like aldo/keto reductase